MSTSFPVLISEKQFMRQYETAKHYVDMGIQDYFILLDNDAFANVSEIGNTTLKDIEAVFGKAFPTFFRFAVEIKPEYMACACEDRERYQTFEIRPLLKSDRKKLRGMYRFLPNDCWICDWRDAKRVNLLLPFIQGTNGDVKFLRSNPLYLVNPSHTKWEGIPTPEYYMKRVIELLPDYYDALFAVVQYKHVEIAIPIEKNTAKKTFKNREKDADGVKRHLIHNVRQHGRETLKNVDSVEEHLRGRSDFTINGIDVSLVASFDWSKRYKRENGKKEKEKG